LKIFHNLNLGNKDRHAGFSMVELLIAMVLGLFLLAMLVEILIEGKQSFSATSNLSRLQENGRIATDIIVSDLKRAGYMGGNSDIPNIYGSDGQVDPDMSCATANTTWGRMVSQGLSGLNDSIAGYACISSLNYLRGDVINIRHTSPWIAGALSDNQLYLRSSLFEGKIFAGKDEALAANTVFDTPQNVRELMSNTYYIGSSSRSCGDTVVPSLYRVRLNDSGQPVAEELLPGVEDLQVQYGVGGQYLDADAVVSWEDVVATRLWVLVRSECSETGLVDSRTYTMGDQTYTPADNFRRQLYSSVVTVRN
jgi:type IV pilus assembly protein PilW